MRRSAPKSTLPAGDPGLLNQIAWSSRWSDREKSTSYAEAARVAAAEGDGRRSREQQGIACRTLSWQARWRGDFGNAMELCLKAEAFLPERDYPGERADVYSTLGVVHYSRNRIDLANSAVERGQLLNGDATRPETEVDLLSTLATIQRLAGDRARAGLTLGRAQELAEGPELAHIEHNVGRWLIGDAEYERATKHLDRAFEYAEQHENLIILPYVHELAGVCRVAERRFDKAVEHFLDGFRMAKESADRRAQCHILIEHGNLERGRGDLRASLPLYRTGAAVAAAMSYPMWQKRFALALAEVYEGLGQFQRALEQHKIAWRIQAATRM